MELRIKNAAGVWMLVSGLPAMAQESAALKATAVSPCASCPKIPEIVTPPSDPIWFVAGVIVGAALGFLAARVFSSKQQ
jgi:F0F1-type ATP synthase assembly protein I